MSCGGHTNAAAEAGGESILVSLGLRIYPLFRSFVSRSKRFIFRIAEESLFWPAPQLGPTRFLAFLFFQHGYDCRPKATSLNGLVHWTDVNGVICFLCHP